MQLGLLIIVGLQLLLQPLLALEDFGGDFNALRGAKESGKGAFEEMEKVINAAMEKIMGAEAELKTTIDQVVRHCKCRGCHSSKCCPR